MAEAFARNIGEGKLIAESAGIEPGSGLNPQVVQAMEEIGYDMSTHYPKVMTAEMTDSADRIITMGCGVDADTCPAVFVPSEDWGLEDPKGQIIEKVREIRDRIESRVRMLIEELASEYVGERLPKGSRTEQEFERAQARAKVLRRFQLGEKINRFADPRYGTSSAAGFSRRMTLCAPGFRRSSRPYCARLRP
jgi:protein-tyrosine-phosphatase